MSRVSKHEVILAMRSLTSQKPDNDATVRSLAEELESAMDDNDYDGTLDSAIVALECAGYDVDQDEFEEA